MNLGIPLREFLNSYFLYFLNYYSIYNNYINISNLNKINSSIYVIDYFQ